MASIDRVVAQSVYEVTTKCCFTARVLGVFVGLSLRSKTKIDPLADHISGWLSKATGCGVCGGSVTGGQRWAHISDRHTEGCSKTSIVVALR